MLTTIGLCAFAMFRKVAASIAPAIGALFIAGAAMPCAEDGAVMSSREAMTMPMATEAIAIKAA